MTAAPPFDRPPARATRALHLVARAALRLRSPLLMRKVVGAAARALPRLSADEARLEIDALARSARGTCLSRALTVAARLEGARVAIGVARPANGRAHRASPLEAHAWVEVNGAPLVPDDVHGAVVARL